MMAENLRLSELEKRQLLIANEHFITDYKTQGGPDNKSIRANIRARKKLQNNLYYLEFKEDLPNVY